MENDKKKKRNKKRKNKQTTTPEDETILSESTSVDDNHMRNGQTDHNPVSDISSHHITGTNHAAFEETIEHLRKENFLLASDKDKLEDRIKHLHEANSFRLQKGTELEAKIRQLEEEKTALDSEGARLLETIERLEREKASLIVKENSSRETIVYQNNNISRLQAQVVELEESRRDLLQENKRLIENAADYQSKILNLEGRIPSSFSSDKVTKEVLSSQVDAARVLVDKLIIENAELIGKVNELYIELQRGAKTELSSVMEPDQIVGAIDTTSFDDPVPPLIQNTSTSGQGLDAVESVPIHEHVDLDNDSLYPRSSIPIEAGEIVQIPLHEIEANDGELSVAESDEKDAVQLSDAPLIGAPYRLISFMAKYVSGADLVG